MMLFMRAALETEHKLILPISKLSKYTKDFSNQVMFSSPAAYSKGWIHVAEDVSITSEAEVGREYPSHIVGFSCFRVKKRVPEVVLYFVGVHPDAKREGVGWRLIVDMMESSEHKLLRLNCAKDNEAGQAFYKKHGFEIAGESLKGTAYSLTKRFD